MREASDRPDGSVGEQDIVEFPEPWFHHINVLCFKRNFLQRPCSNQEKLYERLHCWIEHKERDSKLYKVLESTVGNGSKRVRPHTEAQAKCFKSCQTAHFYQDVRKGKTDKTR